MRTRRAQMLVTLLILVGGVTLATFAGICGEPQQQGVVLTPTAATITQGASSGSVNAVATADAIATIARTVTSFDQFPVLWLGPSYDSNSDGVGDLPLVVAKPEHSPGYGDPRDGTQIVRPFTSFTFAYGDCIVPPGKQQCPAAVTIVIYPPGSPVIADASAMKAGRRVRARGVDASFSGDALWIETADFAANVSFSSIDSLTRATGIAQQLVGANAKAAWITKGVDFRPMSAMGTPPPTAAAPPPWSTPTAGQTTLAAPTPTPTPGGALLQSNGAIEVGAPSLVNGKVQVPVSTTGSGLAPYAGFSVHLRWDPSVFSFSSANATGSVVPSPVCLTSADADGAGAIYSCSSNGGVQTSAAGLLATIVLTPLGTGCSALHLFTYAGADAGNTTTGTYTIDPSSNVQITATTDGSANQAGQGC